MSNIIAIRGAITAAENSRESILTATKDLLTTMLELNRISEDVLIDIFFSATPDITTAFPAEAARLLGLTDVPLFGGQELAVEGAPPLCIRVLVHAQCQLTRKEVKHVYKGGAARLRPDLRMDK